MGEIDPDFLLAHIGWVGLVVEHNEPLDPLNIDLDRSGIVIAGAHHRIHPVKEPRLRVDIETFVCSCYWEYCYADVLDQSGLYSVSPCFGGFQ